MRGSRPLALAVLALLAAAPASAQTLPQPPSPLVRADAYGTLGWYHAEAGGGRDDWYNNSLHGGAGFGWYWTDHLRTEVEFAATTDARVYSSEPVTIAGQPTYLSFTQTFETRRLGAAQYYQFYRNTWFHPHLGAGLDVARVTVTRVDEPLFVFDPMARYSRESRPRQQHPAVTSTELRPFVAAGFKTYMSQRAFFRSDLRVGVRNGVDEVLLRFGFGVDF